MIYFIFESPFFLVETLCQNHSPGHRFSKLPVIHTDTFSIYVFNREIFQKPPS